MRLLVIIPAYNEMHNIKYVVDSLKESGIKDYVIIDDGSSDKTSQICEENGYNSISLPINLGLSGAFQTGMKYALYKDYDYALQFDGDGQHDVKFIAELLQKMTESNDTDIVIGSRYVDNQKPCTIRMIGSRLISFCIKLTTGVTIKDPTSGMRMYNRRAICLFAKNINIEPEPDTMAYLIRCGYKIQEVPVHMNERLAGKSYLGKLNSIGYMLRVCLSILVVQWFRWKVK